MSRSARGLAIFFEVKTSTQAWKLIQQDYTLRLSLIAHEWATEHRKAWNGVFAEGRKRGNSAYSGPALVEMEIADSEKRARWSYQTCCEIWEIQGRTKCRPFFRAIFDWCLNPIFATREGCFRSGLEQHQKRAGARIPQDLSAIGGHMKREMDRLRAKWSTILEIATRDAENQERLKREQDTRKALEPVERSLPLPFVNQTGDISSGFTWTQLETRFRDIQAKPAPGRRVSATLTRTEWETGSINEEWTLGGDSICRTEFERFASIAARKLGYRQSLLAQNDWLGRLRQWVQTTGLEKDQSVIWSPTGDGQDQGIFYKTVHLVTERIAELSAMFCLELIARGAPESTTLPGPELGRLAVAQSKPRRTSRMLQRTKAELNRLKIVFGAIQAGHKGERYCAALDQRKLRLPDHWTEEGCPSTYTLAYKDKRWRHRIQDEKSRYREQYDKIAPKEREAIIQGESGTRRTRR